MANVNFFSPDGGTTRYPIEDTEARSRIAGQQNQLNAQGVLGAKNLFKVTVNTQTVNGVTFTVNRDSDGNVINVTANGTATANTNFRLTPYANINLSLWTGKPLRLSGCPSGGSNNTYALEIYYNDGQEHWLRDFGDGVELSIPISGLTSLNPNIMIKNGVTVNNLVFKPMLRFASDPDDTYVPFAMTNRELTESNASILSDIVTLSRKDVIQVQLANADPSGVIIKNTAKYDSFLMFWQVNSFSAVGIFWLVWRYDDTVIIKDVVGTASTYLTASFSSDNFIKLRATGAAGGVQILTIPTNVSKNYTFTPDNT